MDNDIDTITIPLNRGLSCVVSAEDADLISLKWYARKERSECYAARGSEVEGGSAIRMHRVVLQRKLGRALSRKEHVDHIDGNTLNNQRSNLRLATVAQNAANRNKTKRNTSGYKGVVWHEQCQKWRAQIGVNGKRLHLGLFDDPLDAHKAYCDAAIKYHGEFANFGDTPRSRWEAAAIAGRK